MNSKAFAIFSFLACQHFSVSAANHVAASASLAHVQAAVNSASDGDEVHIPNGSATWSGGITTSKQIIIRAQNYTATPAGTEGSGATSRNVTIQNNSSSALIAMTSGNSFHVGVGGIRFNEGSGDGAHLSFAGTGSKVPKIFDCYFQQRIRQWPASSMINITGRGGVMWNCMVVGTSDVNQVGEGGMLIKYPLGVRNWETASTMGNLDDGSWNFYVEDTTVINVGVFPDIDDHGRYVARHFIYDGSWGITHGFTSSWGGRHWEFYDGVFKCTTDLRNLAQRYFWCRAGTGIFTDIEVQNAFDPSDYGAPSQLNIGDNTAPTSYPQNRQPGYGHNGSAHVSDPIYIWNETGARAYTWSHNNSSGNWSSMVQHGRDIFVNSGAKPGYSKFTYPHPIRSGEAPPPDTTPPTVTITGPTNGTVYPTTSGSLNLSGTASDDVGVSNVKWTNSATAGNGTATGTTTWSQNSISLAAGTNILTVTASDSTGNTANDSLTVIRTPTAQTNYYVDYSAGTDSNDGTEGSPWKHCPGMVGWTGSGTIAPGDTVYFDRADTWTLGAKVGGPGLDLEGGVTYIGNSWGSGSGRAILFATGEHETGLVRIWEDHASHLTVFRGFELNANNQRQHLIDMNHTFNHAGMTQATKRIDDCICHNNNGNGGEGDFHYGIIVSDHSADASSWVANVEILNTVVYDVARDAIALYPGDNGMISNITVRGCEAYNTGRDPSYDEGHGLVLKANVKNSVLEFNYVHDVDGAAVFINGPEAGGGTGPTGCTVRHNVVKCSTDEGVLRVFGTGTKSFDMIGNIVLENETNGGLNMQGNSGSITARIYNNTFYDSFVNIGNPTSTGTIDFRNNIIYELDDVPFTDAGPDITTHNDNLYFRSGGGNLVSSGGSSYTSATLSTYESTALSSDPLFVDAGSLPTGFDGTYPALFPNTAGLGLQLISPAIDSADGLSGTYFTSINSQTRPVALGYDMGAYEMSYATNSFATATSLNVQNLVRP